MILRTIHEKNLMISLMDFRETERILSICQDSPKKSPANGDQNNSSLFKKDFTIDVSTNCAVKIFFNA